MILAALETKDWLIPLVTASVGFAGGLAGVVIGQRLSRTTQREIEEKRTAREKEAEERKTEREVEADYALTRAAARILKAQLQDKKRIIEVSASTKMWWPERMSVSLDLPAEDRKILAMYFTEEAWTVIADAEALLYSLEGQAAHYRDASPTDWKPTNTDFSKPIATIDMTITVVTEEAKSLRKPHAR